MVPEMLFGLNGLASCRDSFSVDIQHGQLAADTTNAQCLIPNPVTEEGKKE